TRLKYLSQLLANLPTHLPLSSTHHHFVLDDDDVKEEGYGFALNRCLELAFKTASLGPKGKITIQERGPCFIDLMKLFRRVLKQLSASDREFYVLRWVERVIDAALVAGAKIPKRNSDELPKARSTALKRRKISHFPSSGTNDSSEQLIDLTHSEDESRPTTASLLLRPPPATPTPPTIPPPGPAISPPGISQPAPLEPPPAKRVTLFDFGCVTISKEEYRQQQKELDDAYFQKREQTLAREAAAKEKKEQWKRDLTRARVQRHRDKVRKDVKDHGHKAKGKRVKEAVLGYEKSSSTIPKEVAELSRPGKDWKSKRNGKNGGVVQRRHERVNWYHPFLWAHIDRIAPRVFWSPHRIVATLRLELPNLFSGLHRGTVGKWI
ncbi:hypothetical protein EV361DRAFT_777173, partial [Lentinula raphanica]